ncbi:hypothetical protein [Fundidesulfovibrio magnetotacticus]|uniref:hypothetical protein n=1 Tax=Fundidesulfovibrio magnetotacticus TaxID=2730080 RepID=UPI0015670358|nr:hypothetical protein [Fundidesulfovibrio magnetotacticus]
MELVQGGVTPLDPAVPVGQAMRVGPVFKEVTWEQYVDAQGVTRVLSTGEYRMDLPEARLCPAAGEDGQVKAARAFLRVKFTVDLTAKTFAFTGAEFLVYSAKGWSASHPAGLTAFEDVLAGGSGLDCGVLYAPGS